MRQRDLLPVPLTLHLIFRCTRTVSDAQYMIRGRRYSIHQPNRVALAQGRIGRGLNSASEVPHVRRNATIPTGAKQSYQLLSTGGGQNSVRVRKSTISERELHTPATRPDDHHAQHTYQARLRHTHTAAARPTSHLASPASVPSPTSGAPPADGQTPCAGELPACGRPHPV